jgi:hypothetical protein
MDSDVADKLEPEWDTEYIPDESSVYMRIHKNALDAEGRPIPGAFRNSPKGAAGMSSNWDKYSDAESTRRGGQQPPQNYAVVRLQVASTRRIPGQTVEHSPDPVRHNRAHTEVIGVKDAQARLGFLRTYNLAIGINDPVEAD